jgi:Fe-S cluster assembly iron-binding protein IscA
MMDVTAAAATKLWQAIRAAGVLGMPRLRIRPAPARGADAFELIVEDSREPGDEVREYRGIRFYLDAGTASTLGRVELDLEEGEFVFRRLGG